MSDDHDIENVPQANKQNLISKMRSATNAHFSGNELYGNDFDPEEIAEWFRQEEEAYADLIQESGMTNREAYPYHALNQVHGYRHLPNKRFHEVLGFGSAYTNYCL